MAIGGLMRMAAFFAMSAGLSLAMTWTGPLVDSKCYGAEQRNVGPLNTEPWANTDVGYEIRFCSPTHKTKYFAIVGAYGERLKLDDAGNTKAAALVQNITKRHVIRVAVTGEKADKRIRVDSISPLVQSQR